MSGPRRNPAHDEQQGYRLPGIFDKVLGRNIDPDPPKPVVKPEPVPGQPPGKAPDPNDIEKTQAYELYLMGWKPLDIQNDTGIDARKVTNWAYIGRWGERKEYYDALKSKKFPEDQKPIIKAVITANRDQNRKDFQEHAGVMALKDIKFWEKMEPEERLAAASNVAALNKVHRDNLDLNSDTDSAGGKGGHVNLTFLTNADKPGMVRMIEATAEVQRIEDKE